MSKSKYGEECFKKGDKVNAELFVMTYGSLVSQLCRDMSNDGLRVNEKLERFGRNIGVRIIEDFLARTGQGNCQDFKETIEVMAKVAFKMYLNVSPTIASWNDEMTACSLVFDDNPLAEFVELPQDLLASGLWFSNVYCGIIKGSLEMIYHVVDAQFTKDTLRGDDATEIRVALISNATEKSPDFDS